MPGVSQGDSSPPTATMTSPTSQLDSTSRIPRTVEGITTLLKIPELSPPLREDEIEKWVQICEHYRDKAYSGGEVSHLQPFQGGELADDKYPSQNTKPTKNQQHTPDVEYRQNDDIPDI